MSKLSCIIDRSCDRRQEEIKEIKKQLVKNDWMITNDSGGSDLVLFFTCAFCGSKIKAMLEEVSRLKKRLKPGSELVVCGCLPKIDREGLGNIFDGKVISPDDFSALNDILNARAGTIQTVPPFRQDFCDKRPGENLFLRKITGFLKKPAYNIVIARGCSRKCSYCAIRFAVGELRSRLSADVIKEFRMSLDSGYRRIRMLADDTGGYGEDIGSDLGKLLREMAAIKEDYVLDIHDIYPGSFLKYFDYFKPLCETGRLKTIHVPVQSASSRVLKLMNRPYDIDEVSLKLLKIKKYKNIYLAGGVIIGFPGEDDEDFEKTLDFLETAGNNYTYIHFYSDMPGTEASKFPIKVDKDAMLDRYKKIKKMKIRHNKQECEQELRSMR